MAVNLTLFTGSGFWNPIFWFVSIVVALILIYIIYALGEKGYKKGTEQVKPFISGNPEPAKGGVHVRAGNLYWGYMDALRVYYAGLVPVHTGILTDYLLWLFGIGAILFVLVVIL
jgi:hypothetical protein